MNSIITYLRIPDNPMHTDQINNRSDGAHETHRQPVNHHFGGRRILQRLLCILIIDNGHGQLLQSVVEIGQMSAQTKVIEEEDLGRDLQENVVGDDGEVVSLGEKLVANAALVEVKPGEVWMGIGNIGY